MFTRRLTWIAAACVGIATGAGAQAAPIVYHAVDLQALSANPSDSSGQAISGNGLTAGNSWSAADSQYHAVRNIGGAGPQDLGALGGPAYGSSAYGINNSGMAVGGSSYPRADQNAFATHAVIFDGNTVKDIGAVNGDYSSYGFGINNLGQATGWASNYFDGFGGMRTGAFFYDGSTLHDLGTLGGDYAAGRAINDAGSIAGYSKNSNGQLHAFVTQGQQLVDIGTFGGSTSYAFGINSQGDVVGGATMASSIEHAFVYRNGQLMDIGFLPGDVRSEARDINDNGWVVGLSGGPANHGFLFDGSVMHDLASLISSGFDGWTILDITGISDAGQIVGTAIRDNAVHAFRFDLVQDGTVPEPSTWLLVALGLAGLTLSRSRRAVS